MAYPYKQGLVYDTSLGEYDSNSSVSAVQGVAQVVTPDVLTVHESVPAPTFIVTNHITPSSIPSGEVFGQLEIALTVYPDSVLSGVSVSDAKVYQLIKPSSVTSKESIPSPHLSDVVKPDSILSGSSVGPIADSLSLVHAGSISGKSSVSPVDTVIYFASPDSIPSTKNVPTIEIALSIEPDSIFGPNVPIGYPMVIFASELNPNSKLSFQIAAYDQQLYNKLAAMETYCYNTSDGSSVYGPKFFALNDSIVNWLNIDRADLMRSLLNPLYSYLTFSGMYTLDRNLTSSSDCYRLFSMNGYIARIVSQADSYYADYDGTTTPRLDADKNSIDNSASADETAVNNMISLLTGSVSDKIADLMFSDEATMGSAPSKQDLAIQIFINLHYKNLYEATGISLRLPNGVS